MCILLIENQYLAPIYVYKTLVGSTNIKIEQYDFFQKRSFRNRCLLLGANGLVTLSIPLSEGREQKKPTREVRIANQYRWQDQHWKTITSCYNRSPWFEYYRDSLEKIYQTPFEFLFDWNMHLFTWILEKLEIDKMAEFTSSFQKNYPPEILDYRNAIMPNNYQQFEGPPYTQVYMERTGFLPNLSILDLLFCEGKNAGRILRS